MSDPYIFGKDFHDKWLSPRPMTPEERKKHEQEKKADDKNLSKLSLKKAWELLEKEPTCVVIDKEDAAKIWLLYQGYSLPEKHFEKHSYRAFLQALMMSAIDASFGMGFIEATFKAAYMKPVVDVKSFNKMLRKLSRGILKHLWKSAQKKDIMEVEVYDSIIKASAYGANIVFDSISQNLEISSGDIA